MAESLFKRRRRRNLVNFLTLGICLGPALVIKLIFIYFAFVFCVFLGFHNWNMLSPMRFIGMDNYIKAFTASEFWNSIRITFTYVVLSVPICVALGLGIGMLLNWIVVARGFFRLMLFLPVIVSMVVASTVWKLLLDSDIGQVNQYLALIGFKGTHWNDWWRDPYGGSLATIIIVQVWKRMGYNGVLFLAGRKNISETYYEAATIDGANGWQKFFKITIPLISPTTFIVTMLQIIASFKVVESIMLMTSGGPAESTHVLMLYIYDNAFAYLKMGYASALSMILFVIILFFTIIQLLLEKRMVHYQ
jgi:ABC-type sugar transport system permease subunit